MKWVGLDRLVWCCREVGGARPVWCCCEVGGATVSLTMVKFVLQVVCTPDTLMYCTSLCSYESESVHAPCNH